MLQAEVEGVEQAGGEGVVQDGEGVEDLWYDPWWLPLTWAIKLVNR